MLALLYDVHGNLPALEAVLADAESAGADSFVLGGDFSAFGGWPAECVTRLRELPDATWIRGNWERWAAGDDADMPASDLFRTAREAAVVALGFTEVAELAALPDRTERDGVLYVHASPRDDMHSFRPEAQADEEELLADTTGRRVVFGHYHLQFTRTRPAGVELVAPGAVGMPWDGDPRAAWALVHDDGRVELRRAEYDVERAAGAVGPETAARLRTGRFEP